MKIAVVTDSSAGITEENADKAGIYVARMPLTIDGVDYIEEKEISREIFLEKMKLGAVIKTSQPPLGHLVLMFDSLLKEYDHIIFLPISSELSSTYQTAVRLAQDYNNKITVVDAKFISVPLGILAKQVKEMIDMGYNPEQIQNYCEEDAYMWAALIPEDLNYLKRGGRVKPAVAGLANMMKIVPILEVEHGAIDVVDKVRTFKKAARRGVELTLAKENPEDYHFIVLNGGCSQDLFDKTVKDLEKELKTQVIQENIYPIVLAHTGPGTIGMGVIKKLDKESLV